MTTSGTAAGRTPSRRRSDSGAHQAAGSHAAGSHAAGAGAEPSTTDREPDDSMNVDAIKQILDLVREHELTEFELEQGGVKLRVRKQGALPPAPAPAVPQMAPLPAQALAPAAAAVPTAVPASAEAAEESLELSVVTSPIVGTFYRSPDPSSPSFVEVGQRVKKGQTLCIIEAMKLMNEIESEYEGEIIKAYVENGQPVQYGERLFAVKTT
jgi:acetyl-CoA carboxylase biotin carboxyl carrier protein